MSTIESLKAHLDSIGSQIKYQQASLERLLEEQRRVLDSLAAEAKRLESDLGSRRTEERERKDAARRAEAFRLQLIEPLSILVVRTEWSDRIKRGLAAVGVITWGDLIKRSESDLLAVGGFGPKSLRDVKLDLAEWGLQLDMTEEQIAAWQEWRASEKAAAGKETTTP